MTENPKPLLKSIALEDFLSYGPGRQDFALAPLSVLIGANGSGKSNLVEAISVLRAVPKDLPLPIRQGGAVRDWLWRGGTDATAATIEVVVTEGRVAKFAGGDPAVRYRLTFGAQGDAFVVLDERLENERAREHEAKPYCYFGYENGRPMLNVKSERRELRREDIDPTQSILSQRRDPDSFPEVTRLALELGKIQIYRDWSFGPEAPVRASCKADVRTDVLSEAFDNLPARLSVLKRDPKVKKRLLGRLSELAPGFDDLEVVVEGGLLQLFLVDGPRTVPARRLSHGTLRFVCLLAILLDPAPPPLLVIEEPELGLHPDIMPTIRDLLLDASTRAQILATTHSTTLVDAFTEHEGAIVVCDKHEGTSRLARLDAETIRKWRAHGGLGHLWLSGHLGGTRW